MKNPRRENIQGMLIYGYKYLPYANYLFLKIQNKEEFKNWLKANKFQHGASSPKEECMNIAFTANGLTTLGMDVSQENGFSKAFIEGMDTNHRNRILGDFDLNDSENWEWGNKENTDLHAVLGIFAKDQNTLDLLYNKLTHQFTNHAIEEISNKIESKALTNAKEHFGFRDGISQPVMRGLGWKALENEFVNPGEFVLGYENEYNKLPLSPQLTKDNFDFGTDGSYMVFRQLEQNVPLFWETVCGHFGGLEKGKKEGIELASKMVGRWPNGNPLNYKQNEVVPEEKMNDFGFYEKDREGTKCPFGSHIRRTNPRDSSSISGKAEDLKDNAIAMNKHRILRRGRVYGPPVAENMDLDGILLNLEGAKDQSRGLNFICFNTDINRQFEFVQQTWINNKKFHGLYNEVDPIVGVLKETGGKMTTTEYTIPATPVRKRVKNIPPFVKVRGGSYFFLPSLDAIKYLAEKSII